MRNRTKQEDAVMISWISVSRRERMAHPARTAAWLIFLASAAPWTAYGANGGLTSLKAVAVPVPSNLGTVVKDRNACGQLGKAFFWDMQAASDGAVSCGTCHFAGGVDQRSKNTLHPGANKHFEKGAPNSTLTLSLFPFHLLSNPNDRLSPVVSDSDDIVGSQGVVTKNFGGLVLGEAEETGTPVTNPIFNDGGVNTRQVTNRNTPMMINGLFRNSILWAGRGQHLCNG